SLKDAILFERFDNDEQMKKRFALEEPSYAGQKIILQSAVNYIFYPQFMQQLAAAAPKAKLIVILRNPADRAVSSYYYFTKMQREKRSMEEALLYEPKDGFEFSNDTADFTYIEHGLYYKQIKDCLKYFSREQLLVLDYDDIANRPQYMLQQLFSFLGIDESFVPDLTPKNVTGGGLKSGVLQKVMVRHDNKLRKWVVKTFLDSWLPVTRRRKIKQKIFEWNTARKTSSPAVGTEEKQYNQNIKKQLEHYFFDDAKKLDELLGTGFYEKWFGKKTKAA
ncbi:MAG TPA: sulfotransferase domain-containing protein, partial [Chitinophagaceae bacterium]|nr:sulfotransferase domain-containing protein [Chitinophagaceae bacterium]